MNWRSRAAFVAVFGLFVVYAGCFIYRTSFVVDGKRYFSLFDDAMVSMRYGRNLAHGYGLVWNPGGERVEGYTDPMWVAYMAAIHLLPIPVSKTSLLIQVTAAGLLILNLFFVRRLALLACDDAEPVALGAVVLSAAYLPLNNWSLQGMEVSVLLPVMTLSASLTVQTLRDGRFRNLPYLLLGASTLVRPDMAAPLIGLLVFHTLAGTRERRTHLVWGFGSLAAFVAVQTAFRLWYYGDLVPNTYYLKLTGFPVALRISRGAFVLAQFVWRFNPLLFGLPFLLLLRRDRRLDVLLWMAVVQMIYSVYVGGDAWEYWGGSNRYISIAMPAFFVLLSYSLFLVSGALVTTIEPRSTGSRLNAWLYPSLVAITLVCANSIHGIGSWAEVLLVQAPLHTGPGDENASEVLEALQLREITAPDATLAVVRAGTIPYFADRPTIDLLGKNDRHIAREPAKVDSGWRRFVDFRPGHVKFDYVYSIEQLQPDVVVQLWQHDEQIRPYLDAFYTPIRLRSAQVYVRTGSPRVVADRPYQQNIPYTK